MKSNLLLELERIAGSRSVHKEFPLPSYLFVQKYGRTIQKELAEISKVLGREDYFYFKAEATGKEETILQRFQLEEERNSSLGKNFSGCVLIEITGLERKEERMELFEYLEVQQQRISCLFTTKNYKNVEDINKELEQFFFVRVIDGVRYEVHEQLILFEEQLSRYELVLSSDAEEAIQDSLYRKTWQECDMVEKRISHLVSNIVYNRQLVERMGNIIEKEELEEALQNGMGNEEKKRTIGFVIGG